MIKAIADSLLSITFPQDCRSCGEQVDDPAGGVACAACWALTRVFGPDDPLCSKCGCPLAGRSVGSPQCGGCGEQHFDIAAAGGVYEHALTATVLELKRTPHVPAKAGEAILTAFERMAHTSDLLIPVPLSAKRRTERGFNQAEVLSSYLSRRTGVPFEALSLVRPKHTPMHRAGMDRKARESTVKNAFAVARPKLIAGRSITLVDDIFTTGATVSYCAKALRKNGAAGVNVVTLARAVRVFD